MSAGEPASVWRIAWPLVRLGFGHLRWRDAWRSVEGDVPLAFFSAGCQREFAWYLEGTSSVRVGSVAELCEWLAGCEYTPDEEHFGLSDVWQHPGHFEERRRGDCEDHALWVWRKLVELGHEAEFVSGEWTPAGSRTSELHGWVVFNAGGERFVFEAVAGRSGRMVRRLSEARREYVPHFSVDQGLRRRLYAGLLTWMAAGWVQRWRRALGRGSVQRPAPVRGREAQLRRGACAE